MTSPNQLSPMSLPMSTAECELPFDLTWDDLAIALPDITGRGTARVSHLKRGTHQGGHPSAIMTLSYVGKGGQSHDRTLFFKHGPDDSREADCYRFLIERGLAVPDMAVSVDRSDGEVLGLEFLPSIGIGPVVVDDVLQLVATLNSLTDAPAVVTTLPPGMPQPAFEQVLAAALVKIDHSWPELEPAGWLGRYREAIRDYAKLPRALTHGELAPQQIGRTEGDRLVMFDLATVGERPRFADLATLLPVLSRLAGEDTLSILNRYLRQLAEGGQTCTTERAWAELRLTRFVQGVEALPWQIDLNETADLQHHVVTIADDFAALAGDR